MWVALGGAAMVTSVSGEMYRSHMYEWYNQLLEPLEVIAG
jgi:hypothetical protein